MRSGHLPTLEIIITETPAHLRKFHDPESGLALIRPDAWHGPSDSSGSSPDTVIRKQTGKEERLNGALGAGEHVCSFSS